MISVVNVCDSNTTVCDHMCVHEGHRLYRCECDIGYKLAVDKKTCLSKYGSRRKPSLKLKPKIRREECGNGCMLVS